MTLSASDEAEEGIGETANPGLYRTSATLARFIFVDVCNVELRFRTWSFFCDRVPLFRHETKIVRSLLCLSEVRSETMRSRILDGRPWKCTRYYNGSFNWILVKS